MWDRRRFYALGFKSLLRPCHRRLLDQHRVALRIEHELIVGKKANRKGQHNKNDSIQSIGRFSSY